MARCMSNGCDGDGVWAPIMVLPAKGYRPGTYVPARGRVIRQPGEDGPPFALCHRHKAETLFEDLVPREQWPRIREAFASIGRAEPDLEAASLDWEAFQ